MLLPASRFSSKIEFVNTKAIRMNPIKNFLVLVLLLAYQIQASNAQQPMNTNQILDRKQQSIVAISAFTARGDLAQLQKALHDGLDAGLTVNEIKEVIVQLYAYTGFPRSLNALQTFMNVLTERKGKGIHDPLGKEPSPLPTDINNVQFGTEMQTKLVGQPVKGDLYQFAPAIDQFLKDHLFGDIFGRDNLDWKTRELATIAALAALRGVENQLRSHFGVGMYNGLTESQLTEVIFIIQTKVDEKEGKAAGGVLKELLSQKQKPTSTNEITKVEAEGSGMIIRISEIEIYPDSLDKYQAILREEAEASVRLETGVISIFPMSQKKTPNQIRILEVYANRDAYEGHIKTPHFLRYKTATLAMVKSLQLIDMDAIDAATMTKIFSKLKE